MAGMSSRPTRFAWREWMRRRYGRCCAGWPPRRRIRRLSPTDHPQSPTLAHSARLHELSGRVTAPLILTALSRGSMDRMHSKVVSALLLVAVTACSSGESAGDGTWAGSVVDSAGIAIVRNPDRGVWTAEQRWTVEEQLRIGAEEGDANLQFGQLVSLDLDSEGNIYTLDQMGQRVQVFDASGEYVRTLGRPGSGPGEFSQVASAVLVTPGDTITVPDLMLQRATRFTPEGEHATDFPLPMTEGVALKWVMSPDGRIVQQTREMPVPGNTDVPIGGGVLLTRDASGSIQDTLVALPSTE